MFKAGDTVLYGSGGVCKIKEITTKKFGDTTAEYYVISPIFNDRSTFFVPIGNEKLTSKMHKILSKNEIMETIASTDSGDEWIEDDAERKQHFKDIISNGEIKSIIALYKTVDQKRQELSAEGKKLHKADEAALKEAQKIIHEEIALAMDISKEEAAQMLD